jgi:Peptidase M50B-like
VISVLANGALIVLFMHYGSAKPQDGTAYCLSWLLLLSGVAHVLSHGTNASDAATLRDITHVPRFIWFTLWLVITVVALVAGAHAHLTVPRHSRSLFMRGVLSRPTDPDCHGPDRIPAAPGILAPLQCAPGLAPLSRLAAEGTRPPRRHFTA